MWMCSSLYTKNGDVEAVLVSPSWHKALSFLKVPSSTQQQTVSCNGRTCNVLENILDILDKQIKSKIDVSVLTLPEVFWRMS